MSPKDKPQFGKLLTSLFAAYSKPLPEGAFMAAWWDELESFPLPVVGQAFTQYKDEQPTFAPVPAAIRKLCREYDGRPTGEEAWAIALQSVDEANTVVWTQEIAAALAMTRTTLESSGAISARKGFIEAYSRMVAEARSGRVPAQWTPSLGWDQAKRVAVLTKAAETGLLPAPTVTALLPAPDDRGEPVTQEPEGLKALKAEMAKLVPMAEKLRLQREVEAQAEREVIAAKKREIAEQVANHQERV